MQIEELLQEGKFQHELHRLRVNLIYSAHWLNGKICDFLMPFDITQQQFNILRILRGVHPKALSTLQLRDKMIINKSDTSRLVERLQSKNLVKKKPCKKDKRLVDVSITRSGLELLDQIDEDIFKLDHILNIDERQARSMNRLLNKMRKEEKRKNEYRNENDSFRPAGRI
ncbi:MAG: MarR family transcriptional regulator [Bacteroidota bacterium]